MFYLTGFSYIIIGIQTHKKYDDKGYMKDDVAQPVSQNHPDRMESTEGMALITSNRISKCPQLGWTEAPKV